MRRLSHVCEEEGASKHPLPPPPAAAHKQANLSKNQSVVQPPTCSGNKINQAPVLPLLGFSQNSPDVSGMGDHLLLDQQTRPRMTSGHR